MPAEIKYSLKNEKSFLQVALALADSIVAGNFDGIVGSVFMMLSNIFVGTVGLFFEVPSRDFHSYLQCFCNYHIVQAVVE